MVISWTFKGTSAFGLGSVCECRSGGGFCKIDITEFQTHHLPKSCAA